VLMILFISCLSTKSYSMGTESDALQFVYSKHAFYFFSLLLRLERVIKTFVLKCFFFHVDYLT